MVGSLVGSTDREELSALQGTVLNLHGCSFSIHKAKVHLPAAAHAVSCSISAPRHT